MGVNSLPKTVTRQRRGCDLNPGPSAPESNTLVVATLGETVSPRITGSTGARASELGLRCSDSNIFPKISLRLSVVQCVGVDLQGMYHKDLYYYCIQFPTDCSKVRNNIGIETATQIIAHNKL